MVLAPEHPLVAKITTDAQRSAVETYVEKARNRSDLDRTAEAKEKVVALVRCSGALGMQFVSFLESCGVRYP